MQWNHRRLRSRLAGRFLPNQMRLQDAASLDPAWPHHVPRESDKDFRPGVRWQRPGRHQNQDKQAGKPAPIDFPETRSANDAHDLSDLEPRAEDFVEAIETKTWRP